MEIVHDRRRGQQSDVGNSNKRRRLSTMFQVWPRNRFDGLFPNYQEPEEIGHFSLDEERKFVPNKSQLKYFYDPVNCKYDNGENQTARRDGDHHQTKEELSKTLSLDLKAGYDIFTEKDESIKEALNDLLKWILLNRETLNANLGSGISSSGILYIRSQSSSKRSALCPEFICWRGLLTKMLSTPYENKEGWKIAVMRFRNCLYLCEYETEQKIADKMREEPRQKEMTYWGFKFEQYVTTDSAGCAPDTTKPVNNNMAYVSVVRTSLNRHSLVFGGEVDCCEGSKYIELKTSRELHDERHTRNFKRFKLIKWWAQSFLIGIQKVICGFRDDNGIVKCLESFKTADIPKYCEDLHDRWKPNVCFNFCDSFLQFIKDTVDMDYDQGVYVFEWMPRHDVTFTIAKPDSDYAFLPKWYTDSFSTSA